MKTFYVGLISVIALWLTSVVHPDDISYNYWDIGLSLSDRDSDYLSDDLNFFGDFNFSKNLYQNSSTDNRWGVHFWVDVSQSRDLSDDSAYTLTLLQSSMGFGAHYSTETFSTYLRLGAGGSSAKFKTTTQSSSRPIVTGGSSDIFLPPISIFDKDRPQSQTTYTNEEDGTLGKIGIRYRLSERYQTGAAVQWSNIDSFGTEISIYVQKDFENSSFNARTTLSPPGGGYMSLKVETTIDDSERSVGLSLVYSF
ncbi:MAG: hypothetical protein F4219_00095 [Gammaproteobacteria bacterium]|nr:hypothetical protein [Gammaproteobacteria bacterium]